MEGVQNYYQPITFGSRMSGSRENIGNCGGHFMNCSRQMRSREGRDRPSRISGSAPYCCPSISQQPKILYNLLSRHSSDHSPAESRNGLYPNDGFHRSGSFTSTNNVSDYINGKIAMSYSEMQCREKNGEVPSSIPTTATDYSSFSDARPRSKSIGSVGWNPYEISRTPSHDSLASYDSISDEGQRNRTSPNSQSDTLLEVTRSKLMGLLSSGKEGARSTPSMSPESQEEEMRSLSQPGSPPSSHQYYQEIYRKYSEGSQRVYLKSKLQALRDSELASHPTQNIGGHSNFPVDLSCKRKKFDRGPSNGFRKRTNTLPINENRVLATSIDEGIEDMSDHSILKSVLTGRGRSNSLSVVSAYRGALNVDGATESNSSRLFDFTSRNASQRTRVTLAKKNLFPVIARISDIINKTVVFAKSQPEFTDLSPADQVALLVGACPRLMLLYMAETNLQFVVAPIHDEGREEDGGSPPHGTSLGEMPTMQFVDSVQNFIRKCQAFNIGSSEYFYMRMITLFHSGTGALQRVDTVEQANTEARQDLQDCVQHSHPSEKLRYSTLLLTLHTLFGIQCSMLQALFCQKMMTNEGGLAGFISSALNTKMELDEP